MLDQFMRRLRRTQPWELMVRDEALIEAFQTIERVMPEGQVRQQTLLRLDRFLAVLKQDPLKVLGYPPMHTDDPELFRFAAERQAWISAVADLDLHRKRLIVTRIIIKGADHGRD